jgi:hypothetical protein
MKRAVLGRRDVPKNAFVRRVGAIGVGNHIKKIQNAFPIGGDAENALPLTARFRADEVG